MKCGIPGKQCSDVLNKHAPATSTKIRGNSHPYLTADVKLMRSRDSLEAKANKTGSKYIKLAYQHMKNKVDCKIRELRVNYYTNKITENKGNIKGTWKVLLKQLTGKAKKSISVGKLTIDGEEITEKQEISNKLNQYFSSIGEKLSQDIETSTMSPVQAIKQTHTCFKLLPNKCIIYL